jgi:hypothetical protein
VSKRYTADVEAVLEKRHQNGGDYWAGPDGRIGVGTPFSTLESPLILHELQVNRKHEAVQGALEHILANWREDGRIRVSPGGTIYPCHTANAARVLARFGLMKDRRFQRTLQYLFEIQHDDGGWRCKKFSGGRGPETEFSNPGVTLFVLDTFRFTDHLNKNSALEPAVESLLDHWTVKRPIGPCHFGIGTLFMQVEYPFLRYNLFYYVYVLSFYNYAKRDERFSEALSALQSKLDEEDKIVVERPHRSLGKFAFCRKGEPSELATRRYEEIMKNVAM